MKDEFEVENACNESVIATLRDDDDARNALGSDRETQHVRPLLLHVSVGRGTTGHIDSIRDPPSTVRIVREERSLDGRNLILGGRIVGNVIVQWTLVIPSGRTSVDPIAYILWSCLVSLRTG